MQRLFRVIKKKRNLRRLIAVWLLFVMIELFCPALCGTQTFAAEINFPPDEINISVNQKNAAAEISLSAGNHKDQNHQQTVCNDECLCHATAIPNSIVPPKEPVSFRSEQITFHFGEPVYNSLPPPYHPPKLS